MKPDVIEYKGFIIRLVQDDMIDSPADLDGDDPDCFLVSLYSKMWRPPRETVGKQEHAVLWVQAKAQGDEYMVFPLSIYEQDPRVLAFRDDPPSSSLKDVEPTSGMAWIFVRRDKEWPVGAHHTAWQLLVRWNKYLSKDVWTFTIEPEDGSDVLSAWGMIYGYDNAVDMAKKEIDESVANCHDVSIVTLFSDGRWERESVSVPTFEGAHQTVRRRQPAVEDEGSNIYAVIPDPKRHK